MIAPEGFVVLADYERKIRYAFKSLFETVDEWSGRQIEAESDYLPSFSLQVLVEESISEALCKASSLWVYSATGALHQVSKDVLAPLWGKDEEGRLIQSFALFDTHDMKIDLAKMINFARLPNDPDKDKTYLGETVSGDLSDYHLRVAQQFAFLEGYYLTVPKGALPEIEELGLYKISKGFTPNEVGEVTTKTEHFSIHQIEKKLRRLVKEGTLPLREEFRGQYAPDMKIESFKAVWRSVAIDHPELSRPGPKPSP